MCRTGEEHNPFNASRLVNSIENKRVAVITAGARTFSVTEDNINGGKLIKSLCNVLTEDKIYESLLSMEKMLKFIIEVTMEKLKMHIKDLEIWKKIIRERNLSERNKQLYEKICRKLPSLYFNNFTRQVIEERGALEPFRILFNALCKEYNEDGKLSYAAGSTLPTRFK